MTTPQDLPVQTAIDLGAPPPDQDLDWGDLTAGELLRRIRNTSRTEAEKGQWFENLFAQLARNEPEFELEGVWRWAQWPERKRLTGLSGQDIGVDLVALHHDGTWIAIQCKCYASHHRVTKADVQSFLAGSQQRIFGLRWIVTTSRWGRTAENLIQETNIRRIDFRNYRDRRITAREVERPVRKPWRLQREAIEDTLQGLEHHDRGRLIMACGTGKTFTALRIAERFVPDGEAILFLAPTIALVSQARREWLTHTTRPLSSLVVCSDPYAGGRNEQEDIRISELECPVVSNPEEIAAKLKSATHTKVVFCTYQSLMRVTEAQELSGAAPFALTIADEAHRTTGVLNRPREKVDFQLVHDAERLLTDKRLYMTATPRIYTRRSKSRLKKREIEVVDMGDEATYGPQFHRLRFKTAVDDGKLSDYRVIVLGVDQSRVTPGLRTRLEGLAEGDSKSQPTMNDITRVLGVSLAINGLSEGKGIERPDRLPRTMAYANSIKRSKWFAAALMDPQVKAATTRRLHGEERAWAVEAEHLDASASALDRSQALRRLSSAGGDGTLRVVCNVKLFTEGVDVPSLNAVAFLDPRDSQVDVVQAVGRVMRRAEDKNFGYIVVPVVVQPGLDVADALRNSREGYDTLGKVLRALQAHDERLHEDIARFVQIYEPKPSPNAPGDPRDDSPGLFDDLELEPADEGIFAHVAAASGLGQPGKLVADEIAWAVQRAAEIFLNEEVEGPLADALDLPADNEQARKAVRTIAALLLCNACLMHRRLRDVRDMRMLPGLGRVGATDDPSSVLKASWSTILEFDYKPVFEPALAALNALPVNEGIRTALRGLSECADNLADSLNDLGYDHAGPLYHRILGSAKSDGAFYTNNISALLLARLALDESFVDWSDPLAVAKLRIIDPACGTGTLLMAALRTIKARMREAGSLGEGSDEPLHRRLVQDVLCGLDINRHGVQLAACNLTLGAPSVDYGRMNLQTMQHGPQDDGTVRAGSLEILRRREDGPQPALFEMASKLQGTDTLGTRWEADEAGSDFPLDDVDLVIMNPPFTANDKRGQKFAGDAKKKMQRHELRVRNEVAQRDSRAGRVITTNSISTFFTPLADQLLRDERGVVAKVLPATACIGASGESERRFLAERFHIERIVTSHDPKRINFSENTGIHESLLICRRRDANTATVPTEFFSLRRMPATAEEALDAAAAIAAGSDDWGRRTRWPTERVRAGDWTPVQWYDGSLAEAAWELERNDRLEPLGQGHTIGPTRQAAQDSWQRYLGPADSRPLRAVRIFDSVAADLRRTIAAAPEQWVTPGGRREHLWANVSRQAARLLVTERFGTTSSRLTALVSSQPAFGFSWMPVRSTSQATFHEEALGVWLNSTPSRLMLLNRRAKKLTYPRWSVAHWDELRIPKPDDPAWADLAAAWDKVRDLELLPMWQADCPARRIIDEAAASALNVDEAEVGVWRRTLAKEPTISNQPAGTPGDDV